MLPRLRYIGRAISLFFRLFVFRTAKVMFLPGQKSRHSSAPPPPVVGRLERQHLVCRTAAVIPVLAFPAILVLNGMVFRRSDSVVLICILILFFVTPAGMLMAAWVGRKINQLSRQAHSEKYALCPACGYCLKGLPEKHRCPECGTPYDIEEVKRKWSEYLADRAARRIPW